MKRVALVTCASLPEPDPDQTLLLEALARTGFHAEMLAWDDPDGDPSRYDLCVLRSAWNYYADIDRFVAWIERAASVSRLANPAAVVRWNVHKRYLSELEGAGVDIIPTAWVERGHATDLRALAAERGWDDVVIKPAISAASFQTERFRGVDFGTGQQFLDTLLQERDAMVQKYMRSVESGGERALVWIDGTLTHAVTKTPRFSGGIERVSEALPVTAADRATAGAALACVDDDLLYARIDLVADSGHRLCVSELELIEPSLFLLQHPAALERLVTGMARWIAKCL